MIAGAIIISVIPKESVNDLAIILASLFGGGMLALYMIGFFTRRVGKRAIITGLVCGLMFNFYMMLNSFGWLPESLHIGIHAYWVGILMNAIVFAIAYGISFILPDNRKLEGLTIWTVRNKNDSPSLVPEPVE